MNKLIINIVLTVTLSLFGFGWLIDRYVYNSLDETNNPLEPQSAMLVGLANHLGSVSESELEAKVKTLGEQFNANLTLENREYFAFEDEISNELNTIGLQLASETEQFFLRPIPNHPNVLLKLTVATAPNDDRQLDVMLTLLLYFGVSVAVVLWMLPLIKRLTTLTKAADKFGKGDLSARVVPAKYSQINVLENSFNKMATQIEDLIEENQLLANSLSHDLRTPVSCFRFGLDASLGETDVDKKNEYLQRMEKDLENIEGMLNAFLDYASMERKGMRLDYRETNLRDFVSAIVKDLTPIAVQKEKRLDFVSDCSEAIATFDNVWMYRAYANLISNAISYARLKVSVFLLTETAPHNNSTSVSCYICDDGSGIPDSDLERVFNAFVRLDSSRKRNGANFGLGLAIVKRVANWHEFDVSFLTKAEISEKLPVFQHQQPSIEQLGTVVKVTTPVAIPQ